MGSDNKNINGDPTALRIDRAMAELRRGRFIEIADGGRAYLMTSAENLSAETLNVIRSSGAMPKLVVTAQRAAALGLKAHDGLAFIDVSAPELSAENIRSLAGVLGAEPLATAVPVRERPPQAHTTATAGLLLTKAARLLPALVSVEWNQPEDASLLRITAADVAPYTTFLKYRLRKISAARVPLAESVESEIILYRDEHMLGEHLAIVIGAPQKTAAVPVRLHSACLTGDLLSSLRCDCGEQLRTAVARIAELGGGVLLYLDQEGRGIGLANKLRAYALQDLGLDTLDADQHLGFLADERSYDIAAVVLHELGFREIKLLTNNPEKIEALREHGINVSGRLPLVATTNAHNERYIRAKRERAGHLADEVTGTDGD